MEDWLNTLKTETPQQGFELAIKLARMGVKYTQPDMEVLKAGREEYGGNAEFLIYASQVVAIHFQTVAKANNFWRNADND
ncbi:MAG: hexameric tyrosine-coordinated heme protein [Lewinellaceae bacterium]|nr:hexameric tyrosine-coordinated heme protein [Lewinellaceae bacterium]